jgi:DNA repair protein RecO (recombination protein O)
MKMYAPSLYRFRSPEMPRPRVYKTQAIVLRQRKLGEAGKIVTLYASHYGKIDAVAKGVRRTKSRLAGHLEPLTLGSYLLAEGRDLDIVTQAESVEIFPALRADLERLSRGLYCAELVDRLTPERSEGNPVFRLLQESLRLLDSMPEYEMVVRRFELRLLSELGYQPSLVDCAGCHTRLDPVDNSWNAAIGGALCPRCSGDALGLTPLSMNALKLLRLLNRAPFEEIARVRVSGALASEIETHLAEYVRFTLEREVRSARFVETLRQTPAASQS